MLLAVDIGNSNIVIGLFEGGGLKRHWRIAAERQKPADEYGMVLKSLFAGAGLQDGIIGACVISSVAPPLDETFKSAVAAVTGVKALVACVDLGVNMPVLTDNPSEVGSDRLVNAYAAYHARKGPLIVVDFGTATTFDYVTGSGEFAGGVIAPGLAISAEALFDKAAKLKPVGLEKPDRVIGKNTVQSMQSGLYYGYASLAEGVIDKMMREAGCEPFVIATGGLSRLIAPEVKQVGATDEFLTLKGLRLIYEGTDDDN